MHTTCRPLWARYRAPLTQSRFRCAIILLFNSVAQDSSLDLAFIQSTSSSTASTELMVVAIGVGPVNFHNSWWMYNAIVLEPSTFVLRPLRQTSSASSIQNSGRAFIDFFPALLSWTTWYRRLKGFPSSRLGLGLGTCKKCGWRSCSKRSKEFPSLCMAWLASRHITEGELCLAATWADASFLHQNICNYGVYFIGEEEDLTSTRVTVLDGRIPL